jgi:hypothetical protein
MAHSLLRNTLLSSLYVERIGALPRQGEICSALLDIVNQFEQMKAFASEIHTELHLVKPILKVLGFAFESKPKFFEEQIKNADFALFRSEGERVRSSPLWGRREYYENVLGLLTVKRYGRNLEEGIGGFYLEFENRIPLYQSLYLMKKSGVPWSILTNGKSWLLMRRPFSVEKSVMEIDLEKAVADNDEKGLHLFSHIFSSTGLDRTLPDFLEEERLELIAFLKEERSSLSRSLQSGSTRVEVNKVAAPLYEQLFPRVDVLVGREQQGKAETAVNGSQVEKAVPTKSFDQADISTYLFARDPVPAIPDFEEIIRGGVSEDPTKESLLSLRVLDMTPGFGNVATRLVETIAYMSFLLPYREKNSFVAEWENDALLHKYILDHVLFGVEKGDFPFDVLQNSLLSRFNCPGTNYRLGNPLLGMSLAEVSGLVDGKDQAGLFSKHPHEVVSELRDMTRLYFSLSDRIREDAAVKGQIEASLRVYRQRMREVMDLLTASYFDGHLESKKIRELLYYMDADESVWEATRRMTWFREAAVIASKRHFFHMEMEFPFLLNDRFDLVVVQPTLNYVWEERLPTVEAAKAHIKRAMTYLKQTGKIVLVIGSHDELLAELKKSKRYGVEAKEGVATVRRR